MYCRNGHLQAPTDFRFPFEPYAIQSELMRSLYEVIENRRIGIFESPTGTGKSLTLTCGALRWLRDHDKLVKNELEERIREMTREIEKLVLEEQAARDWIQVQSGTIQRKDELGKLKKSHSIIEEYEQKIAELRKNRKKVRLKDLLRQKSRGEAVKHLEKETGEEDLNLDNSEEILEDPVGLVEDETEYKDTKIYFCSRTHSQLAQIAREIKRTEYGKDTRCISLASRQNLCINPSVRQLQSAALINERCLDMQKAGAKATASDSNGRPQKKSRTSQTRCPYKSQVPIEELRDISLAEIADIEDLVSAGETLKACPYYSSRAAIRDAQIILLPYQMLLHRRIRTQTGIDLTGSIVIIDEAHNLLDTVSAIYSSEINLQQLQHAQQQFLAYKTKYCSRFNSKNLLKINQLIFITKRLVKLLGAQSTGSRLLRTHQLMSEGEFFNIDLYKILEFSEQTRLAQKVHGCAQREENKKPVTEKENSQMGASSLLRKLEQEQMQKSTKKLKLVEESEDQESEHQVSVDVVRTPSVIRPLLAFLESLTECSDDGQILMEFDADPKRATMKFLLLNPGGHFEEVMKKCRSIIIAGGTMQPTSELVAQLFRSAAERVQQHFYGHVVSSDAVLPLVASKGPSGKQFLFNFTNRTNLEMLADLGKTLQNVCNTVPAGIVCFLSSYEYLDFVYKFFSERGFIANIEKRKFIFREPRAAGKATEKILAEYATATADNRRQGAILFSVVGGKLSEGLNFADDLGRCVIVVGMPYPNKNSAELQEKMRYLDGMLGAGSGSEYYENLCMKAVNQCIGRSVRHINDYASVLLIDERYASERVQKKLPKWISSNLKSLESFGLVQGTVAKFFWTRRKMK